MTASRRTHRLYGAERPGLEQARTWIGHRVTDTNGTGVGRLEDVWVDAHTGEPAWLLVREGRFGGGRHRLVPFEAATEGGGRVWLPYRRDQIRSAPEIGTHSVLTASLGEKLHDHYGSRSRSR